MFDSISVVHIWSRSVAVLWDTRVGFEINGNKENEDIAFMKLLIEVSHLCFIKSKLKSPGTKRLRYILASE